MRAATMVSMKNAPPTKVKKPNKKNFSKIQKQTNKKPADNKNGSPKKVIEKVVKNNRPKNNNKVNAVVKQEIVKKPNENLVKVVGKEAIKKKPNKRNKRKKGVQKEEESTTTINSTNNKPSKVVDKVVEAVKEPKKAEIKQKKGKYIFPSASITEELATKSLDALLDVLLVQDAKKNAIFDDEKPIFVEIHCIKIQNMRGNVKFLLPHSTVASTGEVCFVAPDVKKGRKHDHEPTIDKWEDVLKNAGVTQVKTILPVRQLRVEYDQFELKRRLLTQHDFIMVDTRVLSHVSKLLGKAFFKKHNMLIPVRINEKNLKTSIDVGLRTAMLRLNEGETSVITIGHTNMPKEHLRKNLLGLVKQLNEKYPGGEGNIRAINIKLPLSPSLPLYLTLRPSTTIKPPKLTQKRPKNYTVVEGELSTMLNKTVKVAPDGSVHIKKAKKAKKGPISKTEEESDTALSDVEASEEELEEGQSENESE